MKRVFIFLAVVLLAGCAALQPPGETPADLDRFETLPTDGRVRYEPGAQSVAERVASLLPAAIAQVEAAHYQPFLLPVVVNICGTNACFEENVPGGARYTAAVIYENRLLLAPRLFDREPARLYPILVHELSHLHLGQRLGHYTLHIPVWFHEGLASLAAASGGADLVSEEDARRAIVAGNYFLPEAVHDDTRRIYADHWRLRVAMLYRQSMMLLSELRASGEKQFHALLDSLQQRVPFDAAFSSAFGTGALELAQRYFDGIRCKELECAAPAAAP